mmetsp:Transcript_21962/g.34964  ORF Transcript_21962/g.34964 Transcript_21962/m.34964 type:complete len:83 (+) Transcript_21962:420-668(+)
MLERSGVVALNDCCKSPTVGIQPSMLEGTLRFHFRALALLLGLFACFFGGTFDATSIGLGAVGDVAAAAVPLPLLGSFAFPF